LSDPSLILKARKLVLISFLGGSLIFVLFYITEHLLLAIVGLIFLVVMAILNAIVFLKLVKEMGNATGKKQFLKTTLVLMLLNIPIAYLYVRVGLKIVMDGILPE